ncbi:MAG: hypothetical protein NT061_11880 [Spirochaetes bacterium]|nr:hypothetical protein [Spirochaetota bacterium]
MIAPDRTDIDGEIDALVKNLAELRRAVRRGNPLLRRVGESKLYPILILFLGLSISVFCFLAQAAAGWPDEARTLLSTTALVYFVLFAALGGTVKIVLSKRIMRQYDSLGWIALVKALYGHKSASLLVCAGLAMATGVVFLLREGQPEYIIPLVGVFFSFAAHSLILIVDLLEYKVLGWSTFALGILSLFFVGTAPWLWCGLVFGLGFTASGLAGLGRAFGKLEDVEGNDGRK